MTPLTREFRGVWFPAEVWLDDRLTATEKIILLEIDSLDGPEGCYASNEYLAEFCQCSKNKVVEAVSKLKRLGYVKVASFDGRTRVLNTTLQDGAKSYEAVQNGEAAYQKNGRQDTRKVGQRILIENTSNKKERKCGYDEAIKAYTNDPELRDALIEFVKMRKLIKAPMTDRAVKLLFTNLDKLASDEQTKVAILNQSIANSWKGVFALRDGRMSQRPRKEVPRADFSGYVREGEYLVYEP